MCFRRQLILSLLIMQLIETSCLIREQPWQSSLFNSKEKSIFMKWTKSSRSCFVRPHFRDIRRTTRIQSPSFKSALYMSVSKPPNPSTFSLFQDSPFSSFSSTPFHDEEKKKMVTTLTGTIQTMLIIGAIF